MPKSAIDFPTPTRIHVAVAVRDVDRSLAFYRTLFGCEPAKVRPGYAKFEVVDPPLNFTLNQAQEGIGHRGPQHLGIQVKHSDAVAEAQHRMESAGIETLVETQTNCCHAIQDKFWAIDPDGHRWEVFVVTQADAPATEPVPSIVDPDCCAPSCCPDEQQAEVAKPEPDCCAPSCCA